jgi:hypothetical protein
MELLLKETAKNNKTTIVTHHAVECKLVEKLKPNEIRLCKVGTEARPASQEDIDMVKQKLSEMSQDNKQILVTPYHLEFISVEMPQPE